MMRDPIHHDDEGWWFWEETWAHRSGPFTTEQEARQALDEYCEQL